MMAKLLEGRPGITFLSGGTDGSDGPTEATGAIADSDTSKKALNLSMSMDQYINNCDSYHFFKEEGGLIITGPTQTNVMDLMVVLIDH
jgi:hydroxypyruvate reductase